MALSNSTLKNLISAKKLKLILKNTNLRIIDCRWFLGKKEKGINLYKQKVPNFSSCSLKYLFELFYNY